MRSLKNHISLIIPLFAILFTVEFYLLIDKIIKNYEKYLSKDYSIVVVAKEPLKLENLRQKIEDVIKLKEVDSSLVLGRLKQTGIDLDPDQLKSYLPRFYKLYLSSFPSTQRLQSLKEELLQIEGIQRVETFTKTHEKIYKFLIFLNNISKFFLAIILVTGLMLVFKQIEIWNLEHSERMYIMALFGAPFWMRIAVLLKLSIIDTLISTLLVYLIYLYLLNSNYLKELLGVEDLVAPRQIASDGLWLFGLGLFISIFTVIVVSLREPKNR
ncbi:MAG: cell division protein FtsX [Epsilonproteobacteria bacterium]|nr:cell division protein FtsX [Campylobacterota bacterium]NPA64305.1 cell division protein FtsX [Campylobacterota bacterium]